MRRIVKYIKTQFRKSWAEIFYTKKTGVDFFSSIHSPAFKEYFMGYPSSFHSKFYRISYFFSLGFIAHPLKNILKALTEFPVTILCNTLNDLTKAYQHRIPPLSYLFMTFSILAHMLRGFICTITSPIATIYEIFEHNALGRFILTLLNYFATELFITASFWSVLLVLGIFNPIIASIFSYLYIFHYMVNLYRTQQSVELSKQRETILSVIKIEFQRLNRGLENSTQFEHMTPEAVEKFWQALVTEVMQNHDTNIMEKVKLMLERKILLQKLKTRPDFKFMAFNPNTAICPLSKTELGFATGHEAKRPENKIVKWGEVFCLERVLRERIPDIQESDMIPLPPDLAVKVCLTDPNALRKQAAEGAAHPNQPTADSGLQDICPISIESFHDILNPPKDDSKKDNSKKNKSLISRSFYGQYYSTEAINNWVEIKHTCPLSRKELIPEMLMDYLQPTPNTLTQEQIDWLKGKKPEPKKTVSSSPVVERKFSQMLPSFESLRQSGFFSEEPTAPSNNAGNQNRPDHSNNQNQGPTIEEASSPVRIPLRNNPRSSLYFRTLPLNTGQAPRNNTNLQRGGDFYTNDPLVTAMFRHFYFP